jgi:uncharacterized DUF497 family protein
MAWFEFFWTPEIEAHLAEHGVSPEEFEEVVSSPVFGGKNKTEPRLFADGFTSSRRSLRCIYELEEDEITVIPVTAFDYRWESTNGRR